MGAGLVTLLIVAVLMVGAFAAVLLAGIVVHAGHWARRVVVARASLREDGVVRRWRLAWRAATLALPVRLTGLGSAAHRLDLSLIERQPDLRMGDIRARDLGPLQDVSTYLVFRPTGPQLWVREGWSARHVGSFPRENLHAVDFLEHDPDMLGSSDEPYRGSVGTVRVFLTPELRLYFLVRVRPHPVVLYDKDW